MDSRLASDDTRRPGERTLKGAPGVYLFQDLTRHKTGFYTHFTDVCNDGVYVGNTWEVVVDRSRAQSHQRRTDQWTQPSESVFIVALWVCVKTYDTLEQATDTITPVWEPLHEAHPGRWALDAAAAAQFSE